MTRPTSRSTARAVLRAEGDDLGDAIGAVLVLDVLDDLAAPLLAEVDVEVRHRHPLGIEEALEQEPPAQRIEIGDGERPGHQGPRAGAAPRADRNAVRLGPLDEVRDDEEVARELHLRDDLQFEGEALFVVLDGGGLPVAQRLEARLEARLGLRLELGRLVAPALGVEARQDRLALLDAEGAAPGDLDRVLDRLRQVGEELGHLRRRLEIVLGRDARAILFAEIGRAGDAHQRIVGAMPLALGEADVVGGDERQAVGVGEFDHRRFDVRLDALAVAVEFDIEPVGERPCKLEQRRFRRFGLALLHERGERAFAAAGERDEAFGVLENARQGHMRRLARRGLEKGRAGEAHQVGVAGGVLRQQRKRSVDARLVLDVEGDADDRLDAGLGGRFGEFQRAEQIVGIGEPERGHFVLHRRLDERLHLHRALQQRIGGTGAEMNEGLAHDSARLI
jgi:hypothetical protein